MDNIERFNQYTARVFADLYEAFPERKALTPKALIEIDPEDFPNPSDMPPEVHFLDETLRWLERAGYIWSDGHIDLGTRAVLTPKGLEVLRCVPSTVDSTESVGEQIHRAIRAQTIDAASALIPRALTLGYTLVQQGFS